VSGATPGPGTDVARASRERIASKDRVEKRRARPIKIARKLWQETRLQRAARLKRQTTGPLTRKQSPGAMEQRRGLS